MVTVSAQEVRLEREGWDERYCHVKLWVMILGQLSVKMQSDACDDQRIYQHSKHERHEVSRKIVN